MTNQPALLEVRGLRIEARLHGRRRELVSGIDLRVAPGEAIGIVGESGSGKSMTARALVGLLPAGVTATGEVLFEGRDLMQLTDLERAELRGRGMALLLQDPFTMLNPLLRAGAHVEETMRAGDGRASTARELREAVRQRLSEMGITEATVADRFPFELSGGMRQRVGMAAALAQNCRLLIADEPSTALDVTTQKEILDLLKSIQRSRGMGLILITHNLRVAFAMCDRIYVLYAGAVLETGRSALLDADPLHPYTLGLLMSEPPVDRRLARFVAIDGAVPLASDVATICPFAPRCRWVKTQCWHERPPLRVASTDRQTACIRVDEIHRVLQEVRRAPHNVASELTTRGSDRPLVQVQGVSKVFRTRHVEVPALSEVSIEIGERESVGLVGESGSGKTTLGRCLVGLETPSSGTITIAGLPASNYATLPVKQRQALRRTIQMVFQDAYSTLNPSLTIGAILSEAVTVGGDGGNNRLQAVQSLLERVGLGAVYAARKPVALSGGERQRVAIARALAVRPKILVCDEPVSALDVSIQAQILNLFRALQAELGTAFLFITHDLAVARQVTDRVYVLRRGRVVESGPTDRILSQPRDPYTVRLVESIPQAAFLRGL